MTAEIRIHPSELLLPNGPRKKCIFEATANDRMPPARPRIGAKNASSMELSDRHVETLVNRQQQSLPVCVF